MAALGEKEDGDLGFQIAPMVDVVLVLILFFMANMAMNEEYRLRAGFGGPAYSGAAATPITVSISEEGSVFVQDRLVAGAADTRVLPLTHWLQDARLAFGDSDPVIIAPAPNVPHSRVMQVLSAVNGTRWPKVSFR